MLSHIFAMMVVKVKEEGTIFENSPERTQADVKHEFVPEIRVASMILTEPETVDKFREVSSKLKQDDQRFGSRVTRSSDHKRELPPLSVEPVKRVRTDPVENQPLLLRDEQVKEFTYGLSPAEPTQVPESTWGKWVRSLLFCCWRQH